jgi:hypothetical protein
MSGKKQVFLGNSKQYTYLENRNPKRSSFPAMEYRNIQTGKPFLWITIFLFVIVFWVQFNFLPEEFFSLSLAFSILLMVFAFLFYRLKTTVNDHEIVVSFGLGLIEKRISLSKILRVNKVRNPIYIGWGIRFGPGYTLYNIRGFDAVEIEFKDRKWRFRIGTNDQEGLHRAIASRLKA